MEKIILCIVVGLVLAIASALIDRKLKKKGDLEDD